MMNLFKSRFTKLESFVSAKADERTPEMLAAAQSELDGLNADVVLVPKTDTIKSGTDLQSHLDKLANDATEATAAAKTAQDALTALKGTRVLDDARSSSDAGKGGDDAGQPSKEQEATKVVTDGNRKWNAMADNMGIGAPPAQEPAQ
jgi:hypothetical protein